MRLFEKTVGLIALFLVCLNFSCSEDWRCYEPLRLDVALSQKEIPVSGGPLSLNIVYPDFTVSTLFIAERKTAYYEGDGVFNGENHNQYVMIETGINNNFIYKNPKKEDEIVKVYINKDRVELDFPMNYTGEKRIFNIYGICDGPEDAYIEVHIPQTGE